MRRAHPSDLVPRALVDLFGAVENDTIRQYAERVVRNAAMAEQLQAEAEREVVEARTAEAKATAEAAELMLRHSEALSELEILRATDPAVVVQYLEERLQVEVRRAEIYRAAALKAQAEVAELRAAIRSDKGSDDG